MGCYLDSQGNYYEGDLVRVEDVAVPPRPNSNYVFEAGEWVFSNDIWNDGIWRKINEMEKEKMLPRPLRDLLFSRLSMDAQNIGLTLDRVYQIAIEQGESAPEPAKNYKKFKDFCDSIDALKAQLR